MKRKIISPASEQRHIVVYLDGVQARLASLREPHKGVTLQSQTQEELDTLSSSPSVASGIPSVLRPSGGAFTGVL